MVPTREGQRCPGGNTQNKEMEATIVYWGNIGINSILYNHFDDNCGSLIVDIVLLHVVS